MIEEKGGIRVKQITITVDKDKYERFRQDEDDMGYSPRKILIQSLESDIKICKEFAEKPQKPKLTIVGKEKEKAKSDAGPTKNNITRIGPPPAPPKTTRIRLSIKDELYEDIKKEAQAEGMKTAELAEKWVTERIEASNPEMTETARLILEGIGIPYIKSVK
jgi:ribosome-binding protein aMBF1 (putative translation factor)